MAIDREKVLAAAQKFVEKKKYDKAVLEYQRLIQEDPNDARTLLKIGDLQSKMEAYADAVATYERVGKFYAQQGFALKAIAVYKQIREIILKHVPQLEERYSHITPKLAELYVQLGLTSDALAALDEVATRMQRSGRDGEAIEVFRKIVELDPTNPLPHLRLAEALSRNKDGDGAVTEFGIAAGQLVKLGRRDDALKVVERLLHHKPDPVHARIAAELYLARAQPNDGLQALAKLQICFQSNPKDLDTLALLARAFNAIGQAAKGIEVQKEMARLAQEQGKTELFKQIVERLVRLAPNDEGVKRIVASMQGPTGSSMPPPHHQPQQQQARGRVEREVEEVEEIEDEPELEPEELDAESEEQPFEMRPSGRPPALEDDDGFDEMEAGSLSTDVVVESSIEIVEEVNAAASAGISADVRTRLAHILADAAGYRRQRFYAKAIETLRSGLQIAPRSFEAREVLRDVLLEAGQEREAVLEMLDLASMQIDALDGDGAAQTLQDVLALDPQNPRAADMLRELGYELVEEPQAPSPTSARYQADLAPMREQYPSYDPDAPLPSYDLEEIGPEAVAPHYSDPVMRAQHPATQSPQQGLDDIDDPFGDGAPLPQFPLEPAAESEAQFDLVSRDPEPYDDGLGADDPFDGAPQQEDMRTDAAMQLPQQAQEAMPEDEPPTATRGQPAAVGAELEEALEEADFFASRGLYDDARTILEEQLARLPKHRLILERMAEIEAQERSAQGGSGTREKPRNSPSQPTEVDRSFDIAESLGALEQDRPSSTGTAPRAFASGDKQIDVEEVFAKFKEGVAKQISVDDAQSHYDLGGAYKEMGLLDDAIREFETAGRDPKRECVCQSMVGMIQLERGSINEAIDAFMRALHAPIRTPDQEMALCYEIGAAYEAKKMVKEAISYYQRVQRRDATYRDVAERVRRLTAPGKGPMRAQAVGADDEFDRAFDDILGGGGKLP